MSSPVASLVDGVIGQVSAGSELSTMVSEEQRARILRGLFDSYYADLAQPVIFDTNRAWTAKLPALMRLFPKARIICCVRDVAWVMDSRERQHRNIAFEHTRLFNNPAERSTVYTRVEALANATRLVGFAWHATREACYSEFAERVLILEYDLLAARPAEVFKLVYAFLGEEPFAHDFGKVEYDAPEFDAQLGMDGLHRVRPEVKPQARSTILPPDLFGRYAQLSFWRDLKDSKAFRIVEQGTAEKQRETMPEPAARRTRSSPSPTARASTAAIISSARNGRGRGEWRASMDGASNGPRMRGASVFRVVAAPRVSDPSPPQRLGRFLSSIPQVNQFINELF